ncbi:ATP-binding protein [Lachnospiraceae bacterium OttesenSCG-928-D06]|nr:ATP-binding protein [Lachnospiraceae bacterium OttesenSCG-928-D06]
MRDYMVRLSSLTLERIKNVKNGTIYMPMANEKNQNLIAAEILGIYGQNGSGKTAIVDTLYFLQQIMIGKEIDGSLVDYIDVDASSAEVTAEFRIIGNDMIFEVGYHICLTRIDGEVNIEREYLNCAINQEGTRTNKNIFMDYQKIETDLIFKPQKRLDELIGKDKEIKTDLIVARKMAEKSNCSYIFGESSREIFEKKSSNEFKNYATVINALFDFALKDLFVIRNMHSGMISANLILPMAFRVDKDKMGVKGDFAVPLMEPVVLDVERKTLLHAIVDQINTVLYTIIPGMKIDVKDYGKQSLDSGVEGWKVELMSVREGNRSIPIRMESEGIIKIVSILNALIQAFGNPAICLVIDELDAGIFEYMLGELLDIFGKSAKGQLIFTSHNLRALEMLDKESIMFSTVNPNNRYIHMKKVKDTNNLRSMYIRSITLGGQDEQIYEETDSLKISRAFRKAGRSLKYE